jgi:hypothetical protein
LNVPLYAGLKLFLETKTSAATFQVNFLLGFSNCMSFVVVAVTKYQSWVTYEEEIYLAVLETES